MPKRTEVVEKVEVFDDFDGEPLDPDTKAIRYLFNSGAYNLYLSSDSKATVDKFIKDLTDGAEKATGTKVSRKSSNLSPREKQKRLAEFNKATGEKYERYTKTVDEWYRNR